MQKGNVEIKYEHPSSKIMGEYDAQNIRQIILNLLMNAAQHSQNGGVVRITHIQTETESVLCFSDTGTGIKDENLEKVFNPFYTTRTSGTGLGLSISRQLAESMGGSLKALSHQGGAVFELKIPNKNFQYRMDDSMIIGKNVK
jgi:signal transduction histidine kinase